MNDLIVQVVLAFVGVLAGAGATWFFAKRYYERAARELAEEAGELRRLSNLIVQGLEGTGLVEWTRDASGRPVSMVFKAAASFTTAGLSAAGTVEVHDEPPDAKGNRG